MDKSRKNGELVFSLNDWLTLSFLHFAHEAGIYRRDDKV